MTLEYEPASKPLHVSAVVLLEEWRHLRRRLNGFGGPGSAFCKVVVAAFCTYVDDLARRRETLSSNGNLPRAVRGHRIQHLLGQRVQHLEFRVYNFGLRIQGLGSGFRV